MSVCTPLRKDRFSLVSWCERSRAHKQKHTCRLQGRMGTAVYTPSGTSFFGNKRSVSLELGTRSTVTNLQQPPYLQKAQAVENGADASQSRWSEDYQPQSHHHLKSCARNNISQTYPYLAESLPRAMMQSSSSPERERKPA